MKTSEPLLVYFSSRAETTKRFVDKLPFESVRINPKDKQQTVEGKFIIVTPTMGAGNDQHAIPPAVVRFFRNPDHRNNCLAVIGCGNRIWGHESFAKGARILAENLNVNMVYAFEVAGNSEDVQAVTHIVHSIFEKENKTP